MLLCNCGEKYFNLSLLYRFGTNVSLAIPASSNVTVNLNLKLPPPQNEIHTIFGKVLYTKDYKYVQEVLKYSTFNSKKLYAFFGEVSMKEYGYLLRVY
jgi:hypothetical protein